MIEVVGEDIEEQEEAGRSSLQASQKMSEIGLQTGYSLRTLGSWPRPRRYDKSAGR